MTTTDTGQIAPRFEASCGADEMSIRMAACLTNIDAADAGLCTFLEASGVAVDCFALRIVLREAALNAVIHGSGQDPNREVRLSIRLDSAAAFVVVEDDGPGFTWQDRGFSFDITGDGGRGLALMQMYSSELTFNERGNRVSLRRDYEAAGADAQD